MLLCLRVAVSAVKPVEPMGARCADRLIQSLIREQFEEKFEVVFASLMTELGKDKVGAWWAWWAREIKD